MKVGIDIGGSHIGIGLIDRQYNIIEKYEKNFDSNHEIDEEYIIQYITEKLDKILMKYDIDAIGMCAPGTVKGNSLVNLVNLRIDKIDFEPILKKYNNKVIQIQNDAKAAAIAEHKLGSLKGYRDCVFLCMGTGIGSAIIMNNKLLKPIRYTGFELGHMIINKNGIKCKCGKKGCFETYCSIKRFKDSICNTLKLRDVSSEVILEKVNENIENIRVQNIIDEYTDNLIVGLSNIIDIFEPEAIALGGSFIYFKDILFNKLVIEMKKRKYVFNKEQLPKLTLAELKNDAGIIGSIIKN